MTKKLSIEGMNCGHCAAKVKVALEEIGGVSNVAVDLAGKSAVLDAPDGVSEEAIKTAVSEVGYSVVSVAS
jgi:Cu2+-exporting ATPase